MLGAWAEAGAPEGNPEDLPPAPEFTDGWRLGTPDLVIQMPEPFTIPADGPDIFRFFVANIDIPEDKMVVAVDFKPGNPRVTHHAIMYLDASGKARERDAADPAPGYEGLINGGFRPAGVLGFWAPGYTPKPLPDGVGLRLKQGWDLAFQMHYHPSGKQEVDQSLIGVYFADKPIDNVLEGFALIDFDVDIPAGEPEHHMDLSFTTPVEVDIIDVVPHMHLIGTKMDVVATLPDGEKRTLIAVDWDFNWQDQFRYAEVVHLPAGTRIDMDAYFDNSADNPYNPNSPPKRVTFGEQTTDEMCIVAFRTIDDKFDKSRDRAMGQAVKENLEAQLKNPKVLANVMRFMLAGTPKASKDEAKPSGSILGVRPGEKKDSK